MSTIPVAELCDRFAALYTGALADVMDELGLFNQALPSTLTPLVEGTKFAGVAFPAWGVTNQRVSYDASIRGVLQCLGEALPNSVFVVHAHGDQSSHFGELCATWMKTRGVRGAVIYGGVRDVDFILREKFPVFALHRTPADCCYRWELSEWNVPITIGEVRITPGDILLADHDGVVCVPQSLAEEVLEKAEAVCGTENEIREAVRGGMRPLAAYEQYGRF